MSKEHFVEKYRHEFGGMVADAATHDRKGGELSMRLRLDFRRIDQILAAIYDELTRVPAIGPVAQTKGATK